MDTVAVPDGPRTVNTIMWGIYLPDKGGIRIRTTIRRLMQSLTDHCGDWASISAFIGKVRYLNEAKLTAFAQQAWQQVDPPSFAKTLLVKILRLVHSLTFGRSLERRTLNAHAMRRAKKWD